MYEGKAGGGLVRGSAARCARQLQQNRSLSRSVCVGCQIARPVAISQADFCRVYCQDCILTLIYTNTRVSINRYIDAWMDGYHVYMQRDVLVHYFYYFIVGCGSNDVHDAFSHAFSIYIGAGPARLPC